ncbi:hypothetical protein BDA99DRAFT_562627 [Phascolomyces articulosus]|uniref:Uncharacterized protein n=1 Tax=Phascolomyces articulosus TaxID=60185 RepID=A0AAD5K4D0_9FUNG|nr:hypothetical protein BDA99DRAFT_562627 [Phascolomyces articulosus]
MHPALIVLIIVSVPLGAWAAYEGAEYVKEWWSERQDRKQYEEFVRQHYDNNEKQAVFRNKAFDDDDDDDDVPLVKSMSGRKAFSGRLRQRNSIFFDRNNNQSSLHNDYELTGMEKSIIARRQQLAREQALLDQQELDLQRRRQSLQNRGNSLMGMPSPSLSSTQQQQPRYQQLEKSTTSLESSQTACNNKSWVFTRPPQPTIEPSPPLRATTTTNEDLGPRLGMIDAAELNALRYHESNDNYDSNDSDYLHHRTMQMPVPEHQQHSRQVSESEESWADVHTRTQSGTSDGMSYNSMRTPSSPRHSYGVQSISSDDNDNVATF